MNQSPTTRYDSVSILFHWITAIAVVIAYILGPEHFGRLMHQGLDPATRSDIVWHESLGILVLAITVIRLVWAIVRPATPKFEMSQAMELAAKGVRAGLWLLLLLVPVSALIALGTEGHPLTLLGGFRLNEIPVIAHSGLTKIVDWGDLHGALGNIILGLAGLHSVAAIYHHVILKDGVLKSMSLLKR